MLLVSLFFPTSFASEIKLDPKSKNELYLSAGMPITYLLNAYYNIKSYVALNYDRHIGDFIIGLELVNSDYSLNHAQDTPDWRQIRFDGKEINLMVKYKFKEPIGGAPLRIFAGYGRGEANGIFERYGEKRVEVESVDLQIVQIGAEAIRAIDDTFFYLAQLKYTTIFYSDSRIPPYGNNKYNRIKSIPSIGVGIGMAW